MLKIVQGCRDSRLDLRVIHDWQVAKVRTRVEHGEELKSHVSCCTTRKKSQAGQAVSSHDSTQSQGQVTKTPCLGKTNFLHSFLTLLYIDPYTHECRKLPKRILREKRQRKTRLIHPQSSHRDSSNSSTLFLSIVKSLRGTIPNLYSPYPYL